MPSRSFTGMLTISGRTRDRERRSRRACRATPVRTERRGGLGRRSRSLSRGALAEPGPSLRRRRSRRRRPRLPRVARGLRSRARLRLHRRTRPSVGALRPRAAPAAVSRGADDRRRRGPRAGRLALRGAVRPARRRRRAPVAAVALPRTQPPDHVAAVGARAAADRSRARDATVRAAGRECRRSPRRRQSVERDPERDTLVGARAAGARRGHRRAGGEGPAAPAPLLRPGHDAGGHRPRPRRTRGHGVAQAGQGAGARCKAGVDRALADRRDWRQPPCARAFELAADAPDLQLDRLLSRAEDG